MATLNPKIYRSHLFVSCAFLVVLLLNGAQAAEDTCPNISVAGDQAIWNNGAFFMVKQWYRDMFVDHYNLKKGNWDESWGWAKYNDPNPNFEFPKMMSSGRLLWGGIDFSPPVEAVESQGAWSTRNLFEGAAALGQQYPAMRAVSRTANEIDLLYADSSSELVHVLYSGSPWNPGAFPPSSTRVSVSDLVTPPATPADPHPKGDYHISGPPEVVTLSDDNLEVLARQGNALLHFRWSRSTGWTVLEPTLSTARTAPVNGSERYFISTDPVVLQRSNGEIDVFAVDNFRHLIHYRWDGVGWFAEDITHKLQDGSDRRLAGDPVIVHRSRGRIDIFGRSTSDYLIHYEWNRDSGWSSEQLAAATDGLAVNNRLEGQPAAVSLDGETLLVYYRINNYKLYLLTEILGGWFRLPIAQDYAIVGDPVVVKRARNRVHVFVRDINFRLIHAYFTPELGLRDEIVWTYRIDDSPTPIVTNEKRLDVFSRTAATGHLIHAYWTEPGGWVSENVNLTPGASPTFDTVGLGRVALRRGNSGLEVFSERLSFANRTVHFTAAFGPAVSAWHANAEYSDWASGGLHGFKYVPGIDDDVPSARADASRGFWVKDRVKIYCPLFAATPASRASTMLHESTHMIFWRWSHQSNLPGSACGQPCSDNWLFHSALSPVGLLLAIFQNHSMNQIQIEYLTDVSQFPTFWVPTSATAGALNLAINRMNNRILNPPGWVPGTPRPLQ